MARTISAGYASGVTLAAGDDPVSVTATGSIGATDAAALLSSGTADRTIANAGTIAAAGSAAASVGIQLKNGTASAGGTITNAPGGTIAGGQFGIYSNQAVTLSNAGTIGATAATSGVAVVVGTGRAENAGGITGARYGIYMIGAGEVANTGTITGNTNSGVVLNAGGAVANGAAGRIAGARIGVYLYGTGAVANAGTLAGTGTAGYGALLKAGGSFENQAGAATTGGRIGVVTSGSIATGISNAGLLQGGTYGIGIIGAAANVTNAATGSVSGAAGAGVLALAGGSLGNAGAVTGMFGIRVLNAPGTVTNSGSAGATGRFVGQAAEAVGAGVQLGAGGTIVNEAGARISGYWIGAQIGTFTGTNANGGTVLNAGTITANDPGISGAAVWFKGEGLISNAASGYIGSGPYGIVSYNKVTIVNRGTIFGLQHAVFTSAVGNGDRIIVYPGASFGGTVMGDAAGAPTPSGVLELGSAAAVGTIAGFGSQFTGFARVEVDAGATWSLGGTVAASQTIALSGPGAALTLANPGSVAGTITGFAPSTRLVLAGITDITASSVDPGNVLALTRASGGTITLAFDPATNLAGGVGFAADGSGTTLSAPCFAQGTRIATPRGDVPVEALAAGDSVLLARGGTARIAWIGHRRVDCRRHPNPAEVWPVRIAAGAFARGVPSRDLWLSPDHAVFAGGVLVPVHRLANGRTIRQEPADAITYFHVELEAHDVLLAEALPCESYLDTGNRAAFANGGLAAMLHPDFARARWAASGCAPLIEAGAALAAIRSRLLARAGAMGHRRLADPGLRLCIDGVAVALDPAARWHDIALPEGATTVAWQSRVWVPAHVDPLANDTRRLGVAIADLRLDGARVPTGDARLGAGWHAPEGPLRWTDGAAWLHPRGARRLGFGVAMAGQYWADAPGRLAG